MSDNRIDDLHRIVGTLMYASDYLDKISDDVCQEQSAAGTNPGDLQDPFVRAGFFSLIGIHEAQKSISDAIKAVHNVISYWE